MMESFAYILLSIFRGIICGCIGFVLGTGLYKLRCRFSLFFKYRYLEKSGFKRSVSHGILINSKFYGNFYNESITLTENDIRRLDYHFLKEYIQWYISEYEE